MPICESCNEEVEEVREFSNPLGEIKNVCSSCAPWSSEFSDYYQTPEDFEVEQGLDSLVIMALIANKRRQ
jgi:hypothetical protein